MTMGIQKLISVNKYSKSGQALVLLLVFMIVSITITSAAVVILFVNSEAASRLEQGIATMRIAESGAENAVLMILRNPSYTAAGQVLPVGSGTATVTVTGSSSKTILSVGQAGSFTKRIQVTTIFDDNRQLQISSWTEVN